MSDDDEAVMIDRSSVMFKKNGLYTYDKRSRHEDRIRCCNSPVTSTLVGGSFLAFFKRLPETCSTVVAYEFAEDIAVITAKHWRRTIDFKREPIKVFDEAMDSGSLDFYSPFEGCPYIEFESGANVPRSNVKS